MMNLDNFLTSSPSALNRDQVKLSSLTNILVLTN